MSAAVKWKPSTIIESRSRENVMDHEREVLFVDKYHGQSGDRTISNHYNGRHKRDQLKYCGHT